MFAIREVASHCDVFCKAMAMPLITETELVQFLKCHPDLKFSIDGPRRTKPDVKNPSYTVYRT